MEDGFIDSQGYNLGIKAESRQAFTLVEILVVIGIITMLLGILFPVLGRARRQARTVLGMSNKQQIIYAAEVYSADNDDWYPESVASVGDPTNWRWHDPRKLVSKEKKSPRNYRAMSEYLYGYIKDATIMYCPNAPRKYKYLQQAWDAGDDWDNPDNFFPQDPVTGTYCFYWNYVGYLTETDNAFIGPKKASGSIRQGTLLVSDYFGYDNYRSTEAFGSCEQFNKSSSIVPETQFQSSYWSSKQIYGGIKLSAGYTDGHVECYSPEATIEMEIAGNQSGTEPYPIPALGFFFPPDDSMY